MCVCCLTVGRFASCEPGVCTYGPCQPCVRLRVCILCVYVCVCHTVIGACVGPKQPLPSSPFGGTMFCHVADSGAMRVCVCPHLWHILICVLQVRAWGLSNESPFGVTTFCHVADSVGAPRPVTVQNCYNLIHRLPEVCTDTHT